MPIQIRDVNHPKNDKNNYCGPAVVSSVTGCTTGEAAYIFRKLGRRKMITGTNSSEMREALISFGIGMNMLYAAATPKMAPTLAAWLKKSKGDRVPGRVFLLVAGNHWQLISGRRYVCGITREIVSIKHDKVRRRSRVTEVYELTGTATSPTYHTILRERGQHTDFERSIIASEARNRNEVRKLEKEHGFQLHVYSEGGLKYVEADPCPLWPDGFDTMHYGWSETLDRVETCVADPSLVEEGYYSR